MSPSVNQDVAGGARRGGTRSRESIRAYRRIAKNLIDAAKAATEKSTSLDDKASYAALCLAFTGMTWDMRILRDMLMFLGRIHGHDQQRQIVLEDTSSYRALIEVLRAQQAKTVDATPAPMREDTVIDVDAQNFDALRDQLEAGEESDEDDADGSDAPGDPNER